MGCEKKKIYPMGTRENYNVSFYADASMRNYVRAKGSFDNLDFSYDSFEEAVCFDVFIEYTISTIIFSTMSIEAFLNDYAAACLGDDEFYGNFDKLSIEGKFALISKFILLTEVDKGQSYYSRLKALVKERNKLTHSKSKEYKWDESSFRKEDVSSEHILTKDCGIDPCPYRDMLSSAKNALLAMRDIALFFDEYDAAADALARFFLLGSAILDANGIDLRADVLRELDIKKMVVPS